MKQALRKLYLAQRKALSAEERTEKSKRAAMHLIQSRSFMEAKSVLLYMPLKTEIDTAAIREAAHRMGKNVFYPITNPKTYEIHPVPVEEATKFSLGAFGIMEPTSIDKKEESIDLIIVPGVAFGRDGTRIGFGKGCYDRLLSKTKATKIGLCFSLQLTDTLPTDGHDVLMDFVVTEDGMEISS